VAGISVSSVQRIWRAHRLEAHRMRQFKLSNDEAFADKLNRFIEVEDWSMAPGGRRGQIDPEARQFEMLDWPAT
jgi:hypothetical protein